MAAATRLVRTLTHVVAEGDLRCALARVVHLREERLAGRGLPSCIALVRRGHARAGLLRGSSLTRGDGLRKTLQEDVCAVFFVLQFQSALDMIQLEEGGRRTVVQTLPLEHLLELLSLVFQGRLNASDALLVFKVLAAQAFELG